MFAEFDDVALAYEGVLDPSQQSWVQSRIDVAESRLLAKVPALSGDLSETDLLNARQVVVEAVLRVVRNPQGFKSESAGSFAATRFDDEGRGIFFTKEELALFKGFLPKKPKLRMLGVSKPWYVP